MQMPNKNISYSVQHNNNRKKYQQLKPLKSNVREQLLFYNSPENQERHLLMELKTIDTKLVQKYSHPSQYYKHFGYLFTINHKNINNQSHKLISTLQSYPNSQLTEYGFTTNPQQNNNQNNQKIYSQSRQSRQLQYQKNHIKISRLRRPTNWIKYFKTPDQSEQQSGTTSIQQSNILQIIKHRVKTQAYKKSQLRDHSTIEHHSDTNTLLQLKNKQFNGQIIINLNQIQQIIGIWSPPMSYPSFRGIITYKIKQINKLQLQKLSKDRVKNDQKLDIENNTKCKITKYCFLKKGINQRIFQGILQFISNLEIKKIQTLQLITQKQIFHSFFQLYGWRIKSTDFNRIKIQFRRI